jgi:hypothetical protein
MKRCMAVCILVLTVCTVALAAGKGPEVDLIDNKLSISADAISLSRLFQLFDLATGMKSKVPAELANRRLSVRFSDLTLNDGVRKIFQGQPYDYVMIPGRGVIVTAASQTGSGTESSQPLNPQPGTPGFEQPFTQDFQPAPAQLPPIQPQQQGQPAMVPTPFGPIANPNARAQLQQQQQNAPVIGATPQNSLFPQVGQPSTTEPGAQPQGIPLIQPAPTQFGAPSSFGTTNPGPAGPGNGLFGNPSIINAPANQQR